MAVSSSGGVLLDLVALRPWFDRHEVVWVAAPAVDTVDALRHEDVRWMSDPPRSVRAIPRAVVAAWRVLREEQPDVVVSAGTALGLAFFLAARVRRVPSIWVDTLNVVDRVGRVAWVCGRLASATLVQRDALVPRRPRAVCVGELY